MLSATMDDDDVSNEEMGESIDYASVDEEMGERAEVGGVGDEGRV